MLPLPSDYSASVFESLRQGPIRNALHAFLTDLAEVLAKADRFGESLGAASEALQRAERNDAFWWIRKRCVLLARV